MPLITFSSNVMKQCNIWNVMAELCNLTGWLGKEGQNFKLLILGEIQDIVSFHIVYYSPLSVIQHCLPYPTVWHILIFCYSPLSVMPIVCYSPLSLIPTVIPRCLSSTVVCHIHCLSFYIVHNSALSVIPIMLSFTICHLIPIVCHSPF